ncbi:MAG: hypothetical protein IKN27_06700 [Selenomonadaceae bacterium]|nr:hypothetical protein [Selenomonadaceae bacterium]
MKKFFHDELCTTNYALRIAVCALLFAAIFLALPNTTFAKRNYHPVGVIILDDRETKLGSYFGAVQGLLNPKSRARVFVGKDMQEQFQKYWHGFEKQYNGHKINRDDMTEFNIVSGCTKVLFLINSDANPDAGDKEKNSLKVDAYLCTNDGVQETFTATEEFNNVRERRGAFRKCLTEICKSLNQIL